MILFIDYIAVALSIIFLAYGSWSDIKTREVSNLVWLFFLPIGIALTFFRILLNTDLMIISLLSIVIIVVISTVGFYGGMMGGADTKALICIGIAMPIYPSFLTRFIYPMFPLSVLINSFLIASLSCIYSMLRNSYWIISKDENLFSGFHGEPLWKKLLIFISGYKMSSSELTGKSHFFPLEEVDVKDGNMIRRLKISARIESENSILDDLLEHYSKGSDMKYVWVSPMLPMLLFITIGYSLTLIVGDVLMRFVAFLY